MRRFIKTTTLSALLLSALVGGAFAASSPDTGSGDYYEGIDPHATPPAPAPMVPPVVSAPSGIRHVMAEGPRLRHVLAELRTDDRRINMDRREGKLSATASNSVRHEEADIRMQAMAVSNRHDGVIPNGNYRQIEQEIHKLDRDIVRLS